MQAHEWLLWIWANRASARAQTLLVFVCEALPQGTGVGAAASVALIEFPGEKARYGAHNIHENHPLPTAFRSDDLVFGAFFSAGIRAYDVRNPFTPVEVGHYIPEPPPGSPVGQAQMNDVYVDENRIIYGIDRFAGGLYVLELTE